MTNVYLFRIDGAKDNDRFFEESRANSCQVYAGKDFRVGDCGWAPDFVKVVLEGSLKSCRLTLIELEATQSQAIISCRKYLPEKSNLLVRAFVEYLDQVVQGCRSSADSRRESEFCRLKQLLLSSDRITITTAGALRNSIEFIEDLPLIDQPHSPAQLPFAKPKKVLKERVFRGFQRLSQRDAKTLARCIKILDAVIRHCDNSDALLENWINGRTQPLQTMLIKSAGQYSALGDFLKNAKGGHNFEFETVLSDLVAIWSNARNEPFDPEHARQLLERFFPIARTIKKQEPMENVFETARQVLA